jgi:hypothetical protein
MLRYTLGRARFPVPLSSKKLARPSELLGALLVCAAEAGLEDYVDSLMIHFDHRWVNAFVPSNYAEFGQSSISLGDNFTRHIGHDLWTLQDVRTVLLSNVADAS